LDVNTDKKGSTLECSINCDFHHCPSWRCYDLYSNVESCLSKSAWYRLVNIHWRFGKI